MPFDKIAVSMCRFATLHAVGLVGVHTSYQVLLLFIIDPDSFILTLSSILPIMYSEVRSTLAGGDYNTDLILGCLQFTKLCLVAKHVNIFMKPTNSPTQGKPNPRKIRLKVAFGPLFPTANHFSWVRIDLI